MPELPTYADVDAAAQRIIGTATRTPVLRSRSLNEALGAETVFKAENFQRAGAFKFRGAYNALSRLSDEQRRAGVVAYSSGNHAQAVALAARELGIRATIVMPHDSPAIKVAATEGYGARIVYYDRYTEDREAIGQQLVEAHGHTMIPPFNHPDIIAGQGTVAKELIEQAGELDALFVPLGGGGLLSGCTLATRALSPNAKIYGVEPTAANDAQRSFQTGEIVRIETPHTIADGAQTQQLGDLTFEIIRRDVDDVLTVTDAQMVDEMRFFAERMKVVVEPTGCLGAAAARRMAPQLTGKRVGVILSGGNVDIRRFGDLIAEREAAEALISPLSN